MIQKTIYYAFLAVLFSACSTAPQCFKNSGSEITYEIPVGEFNSITVSEGIALVVKQGEQPLVTIKTGVNLKKYIRAEVKDNQLVLTNSNNCNWVRDYNSTIVYVTTPALQKIYSASQFEVRSDGVLNFPELTLESGIYNETASGTFTLTVNCSQLTVNDNQSAYFNISGTAENASIAFYSGDARFEGSNLTIQKLYVFHRSSNNIIVHPEQEVKGTLYSTGNLLLKNNPLIVEVERLYTGKVIYQ
ncbi:head GIN domain-containing protein [Flavobacterium sp. MK4S-17]|uniref:head GIN domain-containing protein n=1 Tax=Flavobacterium sp. MK4S-17 TaxID=2543737 RepID=UPI00135B8116|nr:head GIN domain-containing protein [Flavobacterium sp. MK4S-17]